MPTLLCLGVLLGSLRTEATESAFATLTLPAPAAPKTAHVFTRAMNAARLGISHGKLAPLWMRGGRTEPVAVTVGVARLSPVFDFRSGSASVLLRVTF